MARLLPAALVTLFALLLLGAMFWAWRARTRRQAAFRAPTTAPATDAILVLTGISDQAEINRYPFRPDEVIDSVADLVLPFPLETEL